MNFTLSTPSGYWNPLLWVAFLYVVALVVEKKGVKKYEMVGG